MYKTAKEYYLRTDKTYSRLITKMGKGNEFHIYNILPQDAPRSRILALVGTLQGFVWKGLLAVSKNRVPVQIRGKKRWLKKYYFL